MNFKRIWNNRTFRTFIQVFLGTITAYLMDHAFEIESKKIICVIIMATSTAFTKIMPLLDETTSVREETKSEENTEVKNG